MTKTRQIVICFAVLMILTGAAVFSYPFVSNALANRNASVAVQEYNASVSSLQREEIDALKEAAKAYNDQLQRVIGRNAKGEGVAQGSYIDLIQLGDALGYITIPKIDLNLPIYEGTGADVLAHGIGHLSETSYPLGGAGTHCALSGHRGLAEAELFTNLDKLALGDRFYLHVLDETLAYQVDQILVVEPDQVEALDVVEGEDLCTLITCTPIGINSHRLLVRGTRMEYEGEEISESSELYQSIHTGTAVRRLVVIWPWLALAALLAIGAEAFLMLVLLKRLRQQREDD
ncbi:MAG: class C sortase [Faecousia sp.]